MVPIKTTNPRKFILILRKGETHLRHQVILMIITPSYSAHQRTILYRFQARMHKNVEFCIFAKRIIRDACLFFARGDHIEPVIVEDRERARLIEN